MTLIENESETNLERNAAKQSWNIHLSLDDSIIVDLFQVFQLNLKAN